MSEETKQDAAAIALESPSLPEGLHYDDSAQPAPSLAASPPPSLGAGLAVAPIGGQLISSVGGMVGFCPMGSTPGAQNSNLSSPPNQTPEFNGLGPPTLLQTNYLGVRRWMPDMTPAIDDVTQTDAWAQAVAVTLAQGTFTIEVFNDARFTAPMLAKYGLVNPQFTSNASLNLGCRMTLLHGNPANYPALSALEGGTQRAPDFYYCPCVKLLNPGMVIDALGKKMVVSTMKLIASAPVFHMPYEASNLAAYLTHLAAIYQGF